MNGFSNAGEYKRGKGNKKSRLGPRTVTNKSGKKLGNEERTPDAIAKNKLKKLLIDSGMDPTNANNGVQLVNGSDHLRFMNMEVLAKVIMFINRHVPIDGLVSGSQSNDDTYLMKLKTSNIFNTENFEPYIDQFLSKKGIDNENRPISDRDYQIMKIRMYAEFFKYIRYTLKVYESKYQNLNMENVEMGNDDNEENLY